MASLEFQNAYISNYYSIAGPTEKNGPLKAYFKETFDDLYYGEKTWEKAEIKYLQKAINEVNNNADLIIGGDLSNQNAISSYATRDMNKPLINVYAACATGILSMILSAEIVNTSNKKIISVTTSHNCTSEKQFRNPTEYGGDKPDYSTYTVTGAASFLIENKGIAKITSATLGRIINSEMNDANNLGSAMAPAAFETLKDHLNDFHRSIDYYDLIITGDLSKYGKKIFKEMCQSNNINLHHYDDSGLMIFDIEKQNVYAGGSGPACVSLTIASYIMEKIKKKIFKRVLVIGTGALINPVMNNQKEKIPVIAHAIVLEAIL